MSIEFGSVCSGIEAASVAWHKLGWKAAWLSEIEPFPSAVLSHHYPDVPNLGDMTLLPEKILSKQVSAPDVFCGGTPCQAFSVAGLRRSLDDARGNLSLTFCEIANAIDTVRLDARQQPSIIFWENVPGVLNTKDNAFGCFLAGLAGENKPLLASGGKWTNAGCVFGSKRAVAWRVLDAQYFGVAQRRRRVFVVASARTGFDPSAVLFEFEGVRRDSAPSREAREEIAKCLTTGIAQRFDSETETMIPVALAENTIGRQPQNGGNGDGFTIGGPMYTLNATGVHGVAQPIAYSFDSMNSNSMKSKNPISGCNKIKVSKTLDTSRGLDPSCNQGGVAVMQKMAVRRLTPVECERLQGFPDGYTAIPWRNKEAAECPDGPRYKALGNSWAVPVVHWLGRRIQEQL